jgi:hypothetical protein
MQKPGKLPRKSLAACFSEYDRKPAVSGIEKAIVFSKSPALPQEGILLFIATMRES